MSIHGFGYRCRDNRCECNGFSMASVRGDEEMPIFLSKDSNVQDGVVIHGLETIDEHGKLVENNLVVGPDGKKYAVYVGERVSLAHQYQVHGPALIGKDTFIGMQAFVFKPHVGETIVYLSQNQQLLA